MLPRRLLTVAFVATCLLTAGRLEAQACGGTGAAGSFTVTLTPSAVTFPQPTATHFLAGLITLPTPLQVTARPGGGVGSNAWYVCVRAAGTLGGYGKPLSDLQFFNIQTNSWVSLGTSYVQLATFTGAGSRTISVPMRVLLRWEDDVPGTYGVTPLEFRVSR